VHDAFNSLKSIVEINSDDIYEV